MSIFDGLGTRIQKARRKMKLSPRQFAQRVGCSEQLLTALEEGSMQDGTAIFSIVERIARESGVAPDVLLFSHTNLYTVKCNELKMKAWRIIQQFHLTGSLREVDKVFDFIDNEHDMALLERNSNALAFRAQDQAFEVNEDRVRDLVRKAASEIAKTEDTR